MIHLSSLSDRFPSHLLLFGILSDPSFRSQREGRIQRGKEILSNRFSSEEGWGWEFRVLRVLEYELESILLSYDIPEDILGWDLPSREGDFDPLWEFISDSILDLISNHPDPDEDEKDPIFLRNREILRDLSKLERMDLILGFLSSFP